MFYGVTARVFATVLVLALMLKPCLGLLVAEKVGEGKTGAAHASISLSVSSTGEQPRACKRKCLDARQEEAIAAALLPLAKASGQPGVLAAGISIRPRPVDDALPAAAVRQIDSRKRLALLSRLLL